MAGGVRHFPAPSLTNVAVNPLGAWKVMSAVAWSALENASLTSWPVPSVQPLPSVDTAVDREL